MLEEKILFERFLRTKNLKMTRPREIVLEAFVRTEGHLSAEDIFDAARRIDPGIGQATVFRTLKLLAEAGLARDACQDEGPRRYEHSYHHAHHDHLLCTERTFDGTAGALPRMRFCTAGRWFLCRGRQ